MFLDTSSESIITHHSMLLSDNNKKGKVHNFLTTFTLHLSLAVPVSTESIHADIFLIAFQRVFVAFAHSGKENRPNRESRRGRTKDVFDTDNTIQHNGFFRGGATTTRLL